MNLGVREDHLQLQDRNSGRQLAACSYHSRSTHSWRSGSCKSEVPLRLFSWLRSPGMCLKLGEVSIGKSNWYSGWV